MSRFILALALAALTVSGAFAKDLCIQIDNGTYGGSLIFLKKVKLTPGTAAPLQGYFAQFSPGNLEYFLFLPIDGGSVVNSSGSNFGLGLTFHPVGVGPNGASISNADNTALNLLCTAASAGKLAVLDFCTLEIGGNNASGHVVECKTSPSIP